jgi:hypothetical protein
MTSSPSCPCARGRGRSDRRCSKISSVAREPELFTSGSSSDVGERVARALQEKHRHLHVEEMLRALVGGLAGGVQRESRGRSSRARPGSGSAACACEVMRPPKDLPPAKSGNPASPRRLEHRRAHRGLRDLRRGSGASIFACM